MNRITARSLFGGIGVVLLLFGCSEGGGMRIGTVEFGEFVYSGDVDGDYLVRQLIQLDPPFQACYVRVKQQNPPPEGQIDLELQGGGGRMTGQVTSNTTGSEELGECLIGAIEGLTIIEPVETAPWNYTADWSVTFALVRRPGRDN